MGYITMLTLILIDLISVLCREYSIWVDGGGKGGFQGRRV